MKYAIACSAAIPLRPEPSEKSEMLTQIMFGESVEIFDTTGNWVKIRNNYDGYEGWIDKKTLIEISEEYFNEVNNKLTVLTSLLGFVTDENKSKFLISAGCTLPEYNVNNSSFKIGNKQFTLDQPITANSNTTREIIINSAHLFLNSPYLWGGKNPFGIDCSGLSQVSYKIAGIKIPRDASKQVKAGVPVSFLENSKPGDLAFFDNDEGIITHVGILLSANKIIHATGKVRIDNIDHQGIYNNDLNKYTHKLRTIMNVIGD